MTVFDIVSEPWTVHKDVVPRAGWRARVEELLARSASARARGALAAPVLRRPAPAHRDRPRLALQPEVIVCDEAVSALDVSIQAQVIALLAELRDRLGLAYLFITHDLSLLREFADRIIVMSQGRIVEAGTCEQIFERPQHAYTQALLAASPVPDPDEQAERRRRRLGQELSAVE
jgi:peptide/nickel transport system ATP-binding protein